MNQEEIFISEEASKKVEFSENQELKKTTTDTAGL